MGRPRLALTLAVLGFTTGFMDPAFAGPITPGNIVVVRVGDGSTALSSDAAAVRLVEYTTSGAVVQTIDLPTITSGSQVRLTQSGSSLTEGGLNLSTNGQYLSLIGYDAAVGTATVATGSAIRVIGRIDLNANVDTSTTIGVAYTAAGGSARAVASDGTGFWSSGNSNTAGNTGVRYATGLGATTSTRLVNDNSRQIGIYNNTLFYTSSTAIFSVGSQPPPTSGTPTATSFGLTFTNAQSFFLLDRDGSVGATGLNGLDTLYVIDGSNLKKFEWSGSAWTARGTADAGGSTPSLFGLTGYVNGSNVQMFATQANLAGNDLYSFADTSGFGGTMSGTFTSLATANANFAFRGVAYIAPVPEPAFVLPTIAVGIAGVRFLRRRLKGHSIG
ncbi:MAG: hypothetical protein U0746_18060 [Gemmataceae bacterium]